MPSSAFQTCALRSEEHTSELQSHSHIVCRLLLEKKKNEQKYTRSHNKLRRCASATAHRCRHGPPPATSLLARPSVVNILLLCLSLFFFFNDTATTEIYTLSLHDALPI